jgi:hypothetical protein
MVLQELVAHQEYQVLQEFQELAEQMVIVV